MDIRIGNFFSATYCKISLSSQLSSEALIAHPTTEQPHYPTALKSQPVRRVLPVAGLCRRGALLRRWESALFFKSSLFERSEFGLLENAFSRFPAA